MESDLKNSAISRTAYRLFVLHLLDTQAQRPDLASLELPSYVEYLATIYKPLGPVSPKATAVDTAVEANLPSPKVPKVPNLAPLPPASKGLDLPEGGDGSPQNYPPFGMSARLVCQSVVLMLTFQRSTGTPLSQRLCWPSPACWDEDFDTPAIHRYQSWEGGDYPCTGSTAR